MTIRDILKILSIVPDNYELMVCANKFNRHKGQMIFNAHFLPDVQYKGYGYRDYILPTRRVDEVVVYAVPPGFDEVQDWK